MFKRIHSFLAALLMAATLLAGLTAPAQAASGPLCYVNDDAGGMNNGGSWADAYTDLQSALADANCAEIWVAAGVYKPGANRSDTFMLQNGVAVYGGFAGTESLLSERNWTTNPTILSTRATPSAATARVW